jgi:hypothetical protein
MTAPGRFCSARSGAAAVESAESNRRSPELCDFGRDVAAIGQPRDPLLSRQTPWLALYEARHTRELGEAIA